MGQKVNPKSFNSLLNIAKLWGAITKNEYSFLSKKSVLIKKYLKELFNQEKLFLKSCFMLLHKETKTLTVFFSFFSLRFTPKRKKKKASSVSNLKRYEFWRVKKNLKDRRKKFYVQEKKLILRKVKIRKGLSKSVLKKSYKTSF